MIHPAVDLPLRSARRPASPPGPGRPLRLAVAAWTLLASGATLSAAQASAGTVATATISTAAFSNAELSKAMLSSAALSNAALSRAALSRGMAAPAQEPAAERPPAAPPRWFLEHVERMTAGSGRWIAENPEDQRSAQAAHQAYGQEYRRGIGGASLVSRLFAIENGEETDTFWEFRTFWHPGERRVIAQQFHPSGSYGVGEMTRAEDGRERIDQTFFWTSGTITRSGHETWFEDGDHLTQSYEIDGEGRWRELRLFRWKPQPTTE